VIKLGIFSSTKRPENIIFFRKRISGFYERILVRSWESGYEIRNGVIYALQTGFHGVFKAPWNDVEILIVSEADFPIQVASDMFMENYHIQVQSTVYGRVTNAASLLQNVHNPSDAGIKSLITTACENALISILSTFNTFLQVEQTGETLTFDIQPQVAYLTTRGLTIIDLRITRIDLPEQIQKTIHATTTSEYTVKQIRNIENEVGELSQKYGYGVFDRIQIRGGEEAVRPLSVNDVLSVLMLGQFIGGRPAEIPMIMTGPRIIKEGETERRDSGPRIIEE
jgi:regulator of protease activity HflC (stomatin/prohibitin superfamily)